MTLKDIYVKPEDIEGLANYDKKTHRWVLDISVVKAMNPDSQSDEELQRKCQRYSRLIYNWLYKRVACTQNKPLVEWLISCTEEGRDLMLEALQEEAQADAESGIASVSLSSKIDLSNGATIQADMLDASISPLCKEILDDASVHIGNGEIYFNKKFSYGIYLTSKAYEEYDY